MTDKFSVDQFRISLNFSDEGWHNVTVVAKNFFFTENETLLDEVYTYNLTFEIVGKVEIGFWQSNHNLCSQVKVIQIDDFQLITSKEEPKNFEITFESLGSGTCMEVDFKDGAVKAYGDKSFCEEWLPDIRYDPVYSEIVSPLPLVYVFYQEGIFNVTARAKNRVTEVTTIDDVMVIVTSAPCAPPKIMIPFNSTNNLAPVEFFRAEDIIQKAKQSLNCTPVLSTKKVWTLFAATVNISNGAEELVPQDLSLVAPETFNAGQLIIPARFSYCK